MKISFLFVMNLLLNNRKKQLKIFSSAWIGTLMKFSTHSRVRAKRGVNGFALALLTWLRNVVGIFSECVVISDPTPLTNSKQTAVNILSPLPLHSKPFHACPSSGSTWWPKGQRDRGSGRGSWARNRVLERVTLPNLVVHKSPGYLRQMSAHL